MGKYFIKIGKIRAKIHEIGKIKAIFGLGMTPIYGLKNGQIKSLRGHVLWLDTTDLSDHGPIIALQALKVRLGPDLGPNTLKSIQIHYNYFDLSMITITLQLQDL